MYNLPDHTLELLEQRDLPPDDFDWICSQIEALHILFDSCWWPYADPDSLHTQKQVGFLAGAMDLEREDRLEVMEIILGYPLEWDVDEDYPGAVDEDSYEEPDAYPGPSLKDLRITKWMNSILIDYFLNGDGRELNKRLGYTSLEAIRHKKRLARQALRTASTNNNP